MERSFKMEHSAYPMRASAAGRAGGAWKLIVMVTVLWARAVPLSAGGMCARTLRSDSRSASLKLGPHFVLHWDSADGRIQLKYSRGASRQVVWSNPAGQAFISLGTGFDVPVATLSPGTPLVRASMWNVSEYQSVSHVAAVSSRVALVSGSLYWPLPCSVPGDLLCPLGQGRRAAKYTMLFTVLDDHKVEYNVSWQPVPGAHFNRVVMRLAAHSSERFYGLGNQYSSFMHNGRSIAVMPTEPGIGKGSLSPSQPITLVQDCLPGLEGSGGNPYTSYSGVSHMSTSYNRSLLVYGNPLSLFDFTAVPVPELPGPLPAAAAGSRDPAVDPLPRNLNNSWRCISKLSAGGVEAAKLQYLEAVLGNDFMRTRLAYDRLQLACALPTSELQGICNLGSIVEYLVSDVAAARALLNLTLLVEMLPGAPFRSPSAEVLYPPPYGPGFSLPANATLEQLQCAGGTCSLTADALSTPIAPVPTAMRRCGCLGKQAAGAATGGQGDLPPMVSIVQYIIPGQGNSMSGLLVRADNPEQLLTAYTSYSGRMQPLPTWIASGGAVISMTGGTEAVSAYYSTLKDNDVPMAALFVQDWSGPRQSGNIQRLLWNWSLNRTFYHGWEALMSGLTADGVRMMLYANPYLTPPLPGGTPDGGWLFEQARDQAFFMGTANRSQTSPYIQYSVTADFQYSTVDFTNPDAAEWFAQVLADNLYGAAGGMGYMCDFSDQTPFQPEATLFGAPAPSRLAAAVRGSFPELWQKVSHLAVKKAGLEGEAVFFSRAISDKSPGSTLLHWMGDQNPTWDSFDGIKSVLTATLSTGLSGNALVHSDIGGYTNVNLTSPDGSISYTVLRSRQLLLAWSAMSAINEAIMRTHIGTLPDQAWQVWSSSETAQAFGWLVRIHQALHPYKQLLMQQSGSKGLPLVRHPMWYFASGDTQVPALMWQVMVGRYLLHCPILDENATEVPCYLPGLKSTDWLPLWPTMLPTGQVLPTNGSSSAGGGTLCTAPPAGEMEAGGSTKAGRCWVTVSAQLACPAVFVHRSGLLGGGVQPLLDSLALLASASEAQGHPCGGVLVVPAR